MAHSSQRQPQKLGFLPKPKRNDGTFLQSGISGGVIAALQHFSTQPQGATMNFTNDQLIATQKSNVEAFSGLSEKAFASFEKLIELNMAASKALLGESISHLQALTEVKDAQALLTLQSSLVKPMAEKAVSYSRHLYDIVSGSSADFTKVFESASAESQKTVTELLETSLKNAPAGSEAAVAVIKSAITAGNNAVETAQKSAKQAAQLVESNISSLSATAQKAE
jgi:phasin family protein